MIFRTDRFLQSLQSNLANTLFGFSHEKRITDPSTSPVTQNRPALVVAKIPQVKSASECCNSTVDDSNASILSDKVVINIIDDSFDPSSRVVSTRHVPSFKRTLSNNLKVDRGSILSLRLWRTLSNIEWSGECLESDSKSDAHSMLFQFLGLCRVDASKTSAPNKDLIGRISLSCTQKCSHSSPQWNLQRNHCCQVYFQKCNFFCWDGSTSLVRSLKCPKSKIRKSNMVVSSFSWILMMVLTRVPWILQCTLWRCLTLIGARNCTVRISMYSNITILPTSIEFGVWSEANSFFAPYTELTILPKHLGVQFIIHFWRLDFFCIFCITLYSMLSVIFLSGFMTNIGRTNSET